MKKQQTILLFLFLSIVSWNINAMNCLKNCFMDCLRESPNHHKQKSKSPRTGIRRLDYDDLPVRSSNTPQREETQILLNQAKEQEQNKNHSKFVKQFVQQCSDQEETIDSLKSKF